MVSVPGSWAGHERDWLSLATSMSATGGYVEIAKISCPFVFDPANDLGLQEFGYEEYLRNYADTHFTLSDAVAEVVPMEIAEEDYFALALLGL